MLNTTPTITLEVCVDGLTSAMIAAEGGAQRVELNAALALGGLTPSIGLVEQTVAALRSMGCEVIAMARPRPSGFDYNADELAVMRSDIDRLLEAGVDGIALGVLRSDGRIDEQASHALIQPVSNAGKQAVFHRAFDLTPDPIEALETLISLGLTRVLTSGQEATAIAGTDVIRQLVEHAAGRIEILPGSGITPDNAAQLITETSCNQLHASLGSVVKDGTGALNTAIKFNATELEEGAYPQADSAKIEAMMRVLRDIKR